MKKTGLIILDGWGHREETRNNAIALANTPTFDELISQHPHTLLNACGEAVGLPEGQMGNSEVGHLHIGAGRIVPQNLSMINQSSQKNFSDREILLKKLQQCLQTGHALHLLGLLSTGGVHSHQAHLFSIIRLCKAIGLHHVYIHLFTDGRDTAPKSCQSNIAELEKLLKALQIGTIASICGRFYAMDRDKRWQRTEMAYQAIINKNATHRTKDAQQAIQIAYQNQQTDEFIEPTIIGDSPAPNPNDTLMLMNFRVDRVRQLTESLVNQDFQGFSTQQIFNNVITLTQYHNDYNTSVIFPPSYPENCLGEYIAHLGLKQLRIAETEKYPHVTFFFNGGRNIQYKNEKQILIPSPKVTTYDKQPRMSAEAIKNSLTQSIVQKEQDVFICNFANTDMVGHSGNLSATIEAAETVDQMLGEICTIAEKQDWQLIITSDHGNADMMQNPETGEPHTSHTLSLVPFIIYNSGAKIRNMKKEGGLMDIAPTMLALMAQDAPSQMTGKVLFT